MSPQDLLLPPFFASRSRFKFQQAPRDELQSMTQKRVYYTRERHVCLMQAECWRICVGMDVQNVNNGRRNIKLDRVKCIRLTKQRF